MFSRFVRFVLYPFVKLVRYGALKLMKKMRAPDDARPIISAAEHLLDELVFPSVLRMFREAAFREFARFKKLPVVEHNRIFEELARGMRDASENSERNPRISPPELIYLASAMHATAVGTVDHIRRGRLEEGDPLIRHLSEWLVCLQQRVGKFVRHL